jgi:hypothetical protein
MKTLESAFLRLFSLFLHPGLLILGLFEALGGLCIFWWINQPDTPAINKTWFGYLFLLFVALLAVAAGSYIISRWSRLREEDEEVRRMYR